MEERIKEETEIIIIINKHVTSCLVFKQFLHFPSIKGTEQGWRPPRGGGKEKTKALVEKIIF